MKKRIAFLFPGQGAQSIGMGADFYQTFASARKIFDQANELLGRDLTEIIFKGPEELLVQTENCQLAIFVTSMAMVAVLKELYPELEPSMCAGLSLGEYSAVCASGRLRFADALSLVEVRGRGMQKACEEKAGTMAAIFGLSADEIDSLVTSLNLPNELWVANYNCPGQTVISGTHAAVEKASLAAKEAGAKRAIPLKVHGAFHSGLMEAGVKPLSLKMSETSLQPSKIALVMNVVGNFVTNEEEIKRNLVAQVTHAVRWQQGIEAMTNQVDLYIEIGPGTTLCGMNRKMNVAAPCFPINKIEDLDQIKEMIENG